MTVPKKPHGNLGHKNTEKYKTPAERAEVFKMFCQWIAEGWSPDTFHNPCSGKTVRRMLESYPEEFDLELLEAARGMGNHVWEEMGRQGTKGALNGFNSSSWKFIMANKTTWREKVQHSSDPENPISSPTSPALTEADRAVIDHFKRKVLYDYEQEGKKKK